MPLLNVFKGADTNCLGKAWMLCFLKEAVKQVCRVRSKQNSTIFIEEISAVIDKLSLFTRMINMVSGR